MKGANRQRRGSRPRRPSGDELDGRTRRGRCLCIRCRRGRRPAPWQPSPVPAQAREGAAARAMHSLVLQERGRAARSLRRSPGALAGSSCSRRAAARPSAHLRAHPARPPLSRTGPRRPSASCCVPGDEACRSRPRVRHRRAGGEVSARARRAGRRDPVAADLIKNVDLPAGDTSAWARSRDARELQERRRSRFATSVWVCVAAKSLRLTIFRRSPHGPGYASLPWHVMSGRNWPASGSCAAPA